MDKTVIKMIHAASLAIKNSYSPYSKFQVSACISTPKNHLYLGVNVENGSYGLCMCAEASAIASMVTAGEQSIDQIVIMAGTNLLCPPCGACRQRIYEFSHPDTLVHLCSKDTILRTLKVSELLPLAFDFKDEHP